MGVLGDYVEHLIFLAVDAVVVATVGWLFSGPTDCCNGIGGGGDLVQ